MSSTRKMYLVHSQLKFLHGVKMLKTLFVEFLQDEKGTISLNLKAVPESISRFKGYVSKLYETNIWYRFK